MLGTTTSVREYVDHESGPVAAFPDYRIPRRIWCVCSERFVPSLVSNDARSSSSFGSRLCVESGSSWRLP
jgi:hypothetical protein